MRLSRHSIGFFELRKVFFGAKGADLLLQLGVELFNYSWGWDNRGNVGGHSISRLLGLGGAAHVASEDYAFAEDLIAAT